MRENKRPPSITAQITERIRAMIVNGDIPMGASISERGISSLLNVSKTPVREALARLSNEGLVNIVPQSGVKVFTLSARDVRSICAFRKVLEKGALEIAMAEHREALLHDLSTIEERMRKLHTKGDIRSYLSLDTEFHLAFFDHCENMFLQKAYELYAGRIAALRTHLASRPQHTTYSLHEHGAIVAAVRENNTAELLEVLEQHIGRTQQSYEIAVEDISQA